MRTFDAVGKTPVLLSMLILVLGEQGRGTLALPEDIHSLYAAAIRAAVRRHVGEARLELATEMLRHVAAANPLAQRRTFSLDDARAALRGSGAQLRLWEEEPSPSP